MKVCARKCDQCLFSANKIVSDARRDGIVRELKEKDTHFICHKSPSGDPHTCHVSYQMMPQMVRIAGRLGVIEFVEPTAIEAETEVTP